MNILLHILNALGEFDSVSKHIEDEFAKSLRRISDKLSISDVDVVLYNNPKGVIPEVGIGGYSPSAHLLFISFDAKSSTLKKTIREQLKRTLAHELHHCVRWRNPGYGKTLLEALVSEGLADHFDLEVNGASPQPWCMALRKEDIATFFKRAEREYNETDYNHRAWFFGSNAKEIPRWTGYTLGYYLVKKYLEKHSDESAASLVAKPAGEVLSGTTIIN